MQKDWIYVGLTSLFELFWIYGFNVANTWWHWIIIVLMIATDFHFLSKACRNLPTGTVYAIFAGIGTIGTTLMDIFIFGGEFNMLKAVFMFILLLGVIGLKLADNNPGSEGKEKGVHA
ncbi:SMR family transporter [Bacillus sp. REN3]|uniref:DMT family transporter n=1 Tax=Bacillus sp. REN3 TaxID=2802440 RepID=UPI001AED176A|nr:SMR family transporter [Bacillus sp. REN3]